MFPVHGAGVSSIHHEACKSTHENPSNRCNKPFQVEYLVGKVSRRMEPYPALRDRKGKLLPSTIDHIAKACDKKNSNNNNVSMSRTSFSRYFFTLIFSKVRKMLKSSLMAVLCPR